MKESEKTLERKLAKRVKEMGGRAVKLPAVHDRGLPDRMCLFPGGRVAFAEMKSTGKRPSPIQKAWLKRLEGLGFAAVVIDSTEKLEKFLEKYG
jgi:Holliday junction resolvase